MPVTVRGTASRGRSAKCRTSGLSRVGNLHKKSGSPNQDSWVAVDSGNTTFCAVFDGHGQDGKRCADAAAVALKNKLLYDLEKNPSGDLEVYIRDAFAAVAAVVDALPSASSSGCTGSVVVIRGSACVIGTVGDCTVLVMCAKGSMTSTLKPRFKTKNHRVDSQGERERIKDAGGKVVDAYVMDKYDPNKGIMVTRTFGDLDMRRNGVTAVPDIVRLALNRVDKYILIATDGLWDSDILLTYQGVCDIVGKASKAGNAQHILEELINRTGVVSQDDDCTMALIAL